jgi:hypothetical protein
MNAHLKTLAGLLVVSALAAGHAQTAAPGTSSTKKPAPHKRKTVPAKPSVQSQIEELRQGLQSQQDQIQQLKQQLSDRDQQLQQAQQAEAAAQAAAQQAQQQAQQQAATQTETTQAVSNLQGAVTDLKTNTASLATTVTTVQTNQTTVQKAINSPDTIHFKGVTLSPTGSFLAAETVWRQRATGGDINTAFTAIPLADQPQYYYSEFYGSGRQSRLALLAEGKIPSMTMRGYYEADFLSSGTTSNNNESNSYTLRQRQVWAQAALNSGWTFTGGQQWSLATETLQGMTNRTEALPLTIDPQYEPGFVWERQYGFRVTKDFNNKAWFGVSAENPQVLNLAGHNLPYNFIYGQTGTNAGLYNTTANYSANPAPDLIAKAVFEPGWGHYEVYGIARFFRDRVYPNDVGSSTSSAGAYNASSTGGGVGGSFRLPTLHKHLDIGLEGLWGDGIGRYGDSQIADATVHPNGSLALIHGFSGLSTLIFHAGPRLDIYANYGGDETFRTYYLTSPTKAVGYGSYLNNTSGCSTEAAPASSNAGLTPGSNSTCVADTKDIQQFTAGYWYDFYRGPSGRLRQGFQYTYARRDIWSGTDGAPNTDDNMWWTSFRYYLP